MTEDPNRTRILNLYFTKLSELQRVETRLTTLRQDLRDVEAEFTRTEGMLRNIMDSPAQTIAEILRHVEGDRYIVKTSNGFRYLVNYRLKLDPKYLTRGTRVALDMMTHTIMRVLPRQVDEQVWAMSAEDPGDVSFQAVGGLSEQVRELREVIELPIVNPSLFLRVGIQPPKGVLLYGPPGTGKTLLARAVACNVAGKFLKTVASNIVDKYIGESARVVREMFAYARENEPCIIFIDEIDAIGGKRLDDGQSADREIQRTLMELLAQLDGFDSLGKVKCIMATNRPDMLDAALMRPGRIDRKIEIPLPNDAARLDILKIHCRKVNKQGDVDYETLVKLSDGFNGADLRNVATEAGMFAIRDDRDYITTEDLRRACRKVADNKKLENDTKMYRDKH